MPVDHRFDFLGMNLQAADIDDAAAAAGKDIAIAVQFHHVAGIDEAVAVGQHRIGADITRRGAWRTDAQRTMQHLHLDAIAGAFDEFGGKPSEAVTDFERHASFGRGVSVTDDRGRKCIAQTVENGLVGDFA